METADDWTEVRLDRKPKYSDVLGAFHCFGGVAIDVKNSKADFFPTTLSFIDKGASALFSGQMLMTFGPRKQQVEAAMQIEYQFKEDGDVARTIVQVKEA